MKTTIMIAFVNKTMSFFKSLFTSVILFLFGKEGHHEHNKIEDSMCVSGAGEIKLKFKSKQRSFISNFLMIAIIPVPPTKIP